MGEIKKTQFMEQVLESVNSLRKRIEFSDKYVFTRKILFEKYKSQEVINKEFMREMQKEIVIKTYLHP